MISISLRLSRVVGPWLAAAMLCLPGCGSDDSLPLAPVGGTVSYGGRPLEQGRVVFTPEAEKGTPGPQAVATIDSDGSFRMQTLGQEGAAVGWHRVTVHLRRKLTPEEERQMVRPESLIPEKYSSEKDSPLRFEVRKGSNEYPIELE